MLQISVFFKARKKKNKKLNFQNLFILILKHQPNKYYYFSNKARKKFDMVNIFCSVIVRLEVMFLEFKLEYHHPY